MAVRHSNGQVDKKTDGETDRWTDKCRRRVRQTTDIWTDIKTDRKTYTQLDRHMYRHIDRQTVVHTNEEQTNIWCPLQTLIRTMQSEHFLFASQFNILRLRENQVFPIDKYVIWVRLGQVRLGQVRLGQVRLGQVRLGQVRLGQVLTLYNGFMATKSCIVQNFSAVWSLKPARMSKYRMPYISWKCFFHSLVHQ